MKPYGLSGGWGYGIDVTKKGCNQAHTSPQHLRNIAKIWRKRARRDNHKAIEVEMNETNRPTPEIIKFYMENPRKGRIYTGDLMPDIGQVVFDHQEDCWVLRVAERDEEYPCGVDCCGIQSFAVIAIT